MTSLSTKFFGQPRLTNPTFLIALEGLELGLSEIAGEISGQASTGMQSFNFTIPGWQAPPGNSFLLRGGFHFAVQLRQLFSVFRRIAEPRALIVRSEARCRLADSLLANGLQELMGNLNGILSNTALRYECQNEGVKGDCGHMRLKSG